MERLRSLTLTETDKDRLRQRAHDGVCPTKNGHECYLGWFNLSDFGEKIHIRTSHKAKKFEK